MEYPLVSAIVLSYNHARYAVECLEGVRAQNYPNLELIVNDDASRDDSAAVIQAWLDKSNIPHRFLRNKINAGICRSMNNALSHARGKYISGIAADDVWLPGKLLGQVQMMERMPERVGVLYSDALQMDESGAPLPGGFIDSHRHFATKPSGNIHNLLWEGNFIPAMTTLVRRHCYETTGPFDEKLFFEDWDMWLRISRGFEFAYSETVSAKYRKVSTSMVRAHWFRILDAMCEMCVKHLRAGTLDAQARKAAVSQLHRKAMCSFHEGTPAHKRNLMQALMRKPSPRIIARCAFAWCGLGADGFERARALCLGKRRSLSNGKA
jgi:glycosyltransferase involved in cell wall biosynthesis